MGNKELVVTCVLKSGSFMNRQIKLEYSAAQVLWLKKQVETHLKLPHKFICMTDIDIPGVETRKLLDEFPGWWSKMELFREFDSCFYIDLDTVIVGDISNIVSYNHDFTVLTNLSNPASGRIGSGVMAWNKDLSHLYTKFKQNSIKYIKEFVVSDKWGDQGFIESNMKIPHRFQNMFPNSILSYTFGLPNKDIIPEKCRIVCFHGAPKPWETTHKWVPAIS